MDSSLSPDYPTSKAYDSQAAFEWLVRKGVLHGEKNIVMSSSEKVAWSNPSKPPSQKNHATRYPPAQVVREQE